MFLLYCEKKKKSPNPKLACYVTLFHDLLKALPQRSEEALVLPTTSPFPLLQHPGLQPTDPATCIQDRSFSIS